MIPGQPRDMMEILDPRSGLLASSQPDVLVEISTDNDLLPPSKIQLINKRESQLNACLKESHGCIGYGC